MKKTIMLATLIALSGCMEQSSKSAGNESEAVNCLTIELGLSEKEVIERVEREKQEPDLLLLKKVHLPENANLCQRQDFVDQVLYFSSNQRSYTDTHPQVQMLTTAIKGYEDEFLSQARPNYYSANAYISHAYIRLLSETQNKEFVKKYLDSYPWLVEVITENKWSLEFKDQIISYAKQQNDHLSTDFARAFAQINDPSTKDLLTKAFLNGGRNRHIFYLYTKDLDWIDADELAKQVWKSGDITNLEMQYYAYKLGRIGFKPVLRYLANKPQGTTYDNPYRKNIDYFNYLTGQNLETSEVKQWYEKNREQLTFDPESSQFRHTANQET